MSDNINLDVVLRVMTQGLKSGTVDVEEFDKALKSIIDTGGASEKAIRAAGDASVSAGAKMANSSKGAVDANERMAAAVQKRVSAEAALRKEQTARDMSAWDAEAEALGGLSTQADLLSQNLPRLRYALYDVSNAALIAGTAITTMTVAAYATNIAMDRAFADVLRTSEIFDTTSSAANSLRQEFEYLFTTMPTSWAQLTEIGTLAGQLNIASDSVGEFTQLVAQFAATTDVSIEASATAFGRLSQLLGVPAEELQNLGSSILAVGVNSVATESQIIAISTQITSMAASAGFSADQVFGLSAALASLGTQPELSRGVVTRLFTNISVAINEGGERLDAFGRLAGQTGDEFARAWGEDASTALYTLMEGLGRVEGSKATQVLEELGITASRDVPTILRLAQNSEVLAESLNVAAQGYADGTALADQYNVISSTVAEKLNILVNNFQLLVSKIGEADGFIGLLVDGLVGLVKVFDAIVSNPVLGTIVGITVALSALVGAGLLIGSVFLRGAATLFALQTVMAQTGTTGLGFTAALRGVTSSMFGFTAATGTATVATRGFSLALRALPFVGILATAAALVAELFRVGEATQTAQVNIAGLGDAMAADTKIFEDTGEAIHTFVVNSAEAGDASGNLAGGFGNAKTAAEEFLGVQSQVSGGLGAGTGAIQEQTLALGENADAWVRNRLLEEEGFSNFASNPAAVAAAERIGFDMSEAIAAGFETNSGAWYTLAEKLEVARERIYATNPANSEELLRDLDELESTMVPVLDTMDSWLQANREQATALDVLGLSTDNAADSAAEYNAALLDAYKTTVDTMDAAISMEDAMFGLGESLAQNGNNWDEFSEAGRANLGALMTVMNEIAENNAPDVAANKLQSLFFEIVEGGFASAQQLAILQSAITSLGGATVGGFIGAMGARKGSPLNPASLFAGVASGYQKVEKAARSAAREAGSVKEEVRTLVDYARDLSGVFNRAFDIQFKPSSTLDAIEDQFQSLRDASEESARAIRSLQADLLGLNSDLRIQEYFLSVAIEYGDDVRAQAIRAQIAQTQADIADKTADLNREQSENSKELEGNSEAARRNRAEMESLIQKYQEHITALASSGLSQEELARKTETLRQDFIRQATQLGYNRDEIAKYTTVFDNMRLVIDRMPRNITVSADTNPAVQAMREYEAALNSARANAGRGIAMGPISNPTSAWEVRRAALEAQIVAAIAMLNRLREQGEWTGVRYQMQAVAHLQNRLRIGDFYDGGFTGRGGKYEVAGRVHRGEYVIPKKDVNQATGLPYADALGRLTRGQPGRSSYSGGGFVQPSGRREAVDLSAMSIQQLAQVMNKFLVVDGKIVAETATNANEFENAGGAY